MFSRRNAFAICMLTAALAAPSLAQRGGQQSAPASDDPIKTLVSRLDLDKYKATIKGLTQFGDRRQGTKRNRDAVDWIEAQLKSYGCPTERVQYDYTPIPANRERGQRGANTGAAQRGQAPRGMGGIGRSAKTVES